MMGGKITLQQNARDGSSKDSAEDQKSNLEGGHLSGALHVLDGGVDRLSGESPRTARSSSATAKRKAVLIPNRRTPSLTSRAKQLPFLLKLKPRLSTSRKGVDGIKDRIREGRRCMEGHESGRPDKRFKPVEGC